MALEYVKLASPTYLNNLYSTIEGPLELLSSTLDEVINPLGCPEYSSLTQGGVPLYEYLQQTYPGAKVSN